jgi:hypothetical protein
LFFRSCPSPHRILGPGGTESAVCSANCATGSLGSLRSAARPGKMRPGNAHESFSGNSMVRWGETPEGNAQTLFFRPASSPYRILGPGASASDVLWASSIVMLRPRLYTFSFLSRPWTLRSCHDHNLLDDKHRWLPTAGHDRTRLQFVWPLLLDRSLERVPACCGRRGVPPERPLSASRAVSTNFS